MHIVHEKYKYVNHYCVRMYNQRQTISLAYTVNTYSLKLE